MRKGIALAAGIIACAAPLVTLAPASASTTSASTTSASTTSASTTSASTTSASVTPAYSCTYDRLGTVNANLLRVHTSPNSTGAIGDYPHGEVIEFCGSSTTQAGGYTWVWSAGNLTNGQSAHGWVAENYLTNIRRIP